MKKLPKLTILPQGEPTMNYADTHTTLYDIRDIHIEKSLSPAERARKYIRDGYNPYRFLVGGMVINLSFNGKESLNSCLARALESMQ